MSPALEVWLKWFRACLAKQAESPEFTPSTNKKKGIRRALLLLINIYPTDIYLNDI
jgi:hypothetical protein